MTRTLEIASGRLQPESISGGPLAGFRNKIINGDFDVWQRGTSHAVSGYGSDDRWSVTMIGGSVAHSQQTFNLGQTDVPGNPKYFSRTVVGAGSAAGDLNAKFQKIEGVRTLSGKTATLTFYAKAAAGMDITVELEQYFGTGGSPSSTVNLSPITCTLTTSWQKFSLTFDVPSISSKTIGTDNTDSLNLLFWFSAGSTYDARTNSIGHQSGTIDLAHISLVEGDATLEDDPFEPRHYQQELDLCMRYFERVQRNLTSDIVVISTEHSSGNHWGFVFYKVEKRTYPTVTTFGTGAWAGTAPTGLAGLDMYQWNAVGSFYWYAGDLGFDAEI